MRPPLPPKNNFEWISKNAEFYAEYKTVGKKTQKMFTQKKVRHKKLKHY